MTINVRSCILNFLFTSKNKPITRRESNTNLEFARAGIKHFSCKFICLVWSLPGQGWDAVNSQGTKLPWRSSLGLMQKVSAVGSWRDHIWAHFAFSVFAALHFASHKMYFFYKLRRKYKHPILAWGQEAVICPEWPEMAKTPKISKQQE